MEQHLKHKKLTPFQEYQEHDPSQYNSSIYNPHSRNDLLSMNNYHHNEQNFVNFQAYSQRLSDPQENLEHLDQFQQSHLNQKNSSNQIYKIDYNLELNESSNQKYINKNIQPMQDISSKEREQSSKQKNKQKNKFETKLMSKNILMESSQDGNFYMSQKRNSKIDFFQIAQKTKDKDYNTLKIANDKKNVQENSCRSHVGQDYDQQFIAMAKQKELMQRKLPSLQKIKADQDNNNDVSQINILQHKKITNKGQLINCSRKQSSFNIKSLYPKTFVQPLNILDINSFIKKIINPHQLFSSNLHRDNGCFIGSSSGNYTLITSDGSKKVLFVKRKSFRATSNYILSTQENHFDEKSESYGGSLVSNFSGSIFNFYDNQSNQRDKSDRLSNQENQVLATINYEGTTSLSPSPRSMNLYLLKKPFKYFQLKGSDKQQNLKDLYDNYSENKNKIYRAQNKKPKYNEKKGVYTLNFYGKAKIQSTNNMIIVGQDKNEIMLLGKTDENQFLMDLTYPLQPRIGLAIAISLFDFKWVCQ